MNLTENKKVIVKFLKVFRIKQIVKTYLARLEQNKKLKKFRNIHAGKDFIIMGAGPSLDDLPHKFLEKFIVIGTNKSFKYYAPDYWVVVDAQFTWLNEGREFCYKNNIPAFINWIYCKNKPDTFYPNEVNMMHNKKPTNQGPDNIALRNLLFNLIKDPQIIEKKGFSSISNVVSEGAIPLALYMGCRNIYLIGVDFYTPDKTANYSTKRSKADQEIIEKLTKRFHKEEGSKKDMWEYKRWTIELISETSIKDRIFNLSVKSSIKKIKKVNYKEVTGIK